jgi:hypothetical protein
VILSAFATTGESWTPHQNERADYRLASELRMLSDPTIHKEARAAMEAAFDLLTPQDEAVDRTELGIPDGRIQFQGAWDEVRRYNPKSPIDGTKPRRAAHQRRLTWLREALGTLPDRVVLAGLTGKEARRQSQMMASLRPITDLLALRDRKGLTPQQLQRLQELFNQAPAEVKQMLAPKDLLLPGPFEQMPKETITRNEDGEPT